MFSMHKFLFFFSLTSAPGAGALVKFQALHTIPVMITTLILWFFFSFLAATISHRSVCHW